MTETVAMILFKPDTGQVLLQHRSDDAPTFPDHFSPFGGAIEPGELPQDAMLREAFEELSLDVFALKAAGLRYVDFYDKVEGGELKKRTHLFVGTTRAGESALLAGLKEGKGLGYFSFAEASRLKIAREDRALLNLAKWHLEAC